MGMSDPGQAFVQTGLRPLSNLAASRLAWSINESHWGAVASEAVRLHAMASRATE